MPVSDAQPSSRSCRHWAVVTTIFAPSEAVRRMRYMPVCVVIVGDRGKPDNGYTFRTTFGDNLAST